MSSSEQPGAEPATRTSDRQQGGATSTVAPAERPADVEFAVRARGQVGVRVRHVTAHRTVEARVGDHAT